MLARDNPITIYAYADITSMNRVFQVLPFPIIDRGEACIDMRPFPENLCEQLDYLFLVTLFISHYTVILGQEPHNPMKKGTSL
jgi:hypothetical protein